MNLIWNHREDWTPRHEGCTPTVRRSENMWHYGFDRSVVHDADQVTIAGGFEKNLTQAQACATFAHDRHQRVLEPS